MMKLYIVILTLIVVSAISGCNANKQESLRVVSLEELEEIPYNLVSEVIEEASDEFIGGGISLTSGLEGIRRYTLKSPRVYFEYLYLDYQVPAVYLSEGEEFDPMNNPNRARSIEDAHNRFEEQYNLFNDYYEENSDEIIMEIQDDRGYIIFDLVTEERISEVTGISETRLCLDRNDMGYYCFCIPPCDCFADIAGDLRVQEEAEGIIPRRIGCIYYYDNMYIETILDSSDEEEIEEFLDFLDELGLPYLLQEE